MFKDSFKEWLEDNAPVRAAALTFFIILPLPSLLLIIVSFFGFFFGQNLATQQVTQQITALAGPVVAQLFRQLLQSSAPPFTSFWASFTVIAFSLGGAIGAFAVLRDMMNVIWEVKLPKQRKLANRIRQTIGPFLLVTMLGLIVIAGTVTLMAVFSAIKAYSVNRILTVFSLDVAQIFVSFSLSTLLFAIIYKVLPNRKVHWRDVALPAVIAGVAFTVTNNVLGTYLQTFTVTTIVGAAGSLIIILLWVYILNQIMLFGAEMSKVYATTVGPHPKEHVISEAEKLFKPFERAGEKLEEAVLGPIDNINQLPEKPVENPKAQPTIEPKISPAPPREETVKPSGLTIETREKPAILEKLGEGVVEVNVKIVTPEKKREEEKG